MRLKGLILITAAAAFGALIVPGVVSGAIVVMEAKLKGSEEPSGGDPDGRGTAEIAANAKKGKVCSVITYKRIQEPVAAHIHKGKQGVDGPIVVTLEDGSFPSGEASCAKNVAKDLIKQITEKPQRFYVNVHTGDFPTGAIRGQLDIEASG